MKKIYHFYHVYADGVWQPMLDDHIHILKKYNLYENLSFFGVGIVGSKPNIQLVKTFLEEKNINYNLVFESGDACENQYEQETLDQIKEFCQDNEGFVLYTHTKGAANNFEVHRRWRKSMNYYNVVKWRDAILHLEENDITGCHWLTPEKDGPQVTSPFFGGNFWWARTDYINTLNKPKRNTRWDAEGWIGEGLNIKAYDMCPGWPSPATFANEIFY